MRRPGDGSGLRFGHTAAELGAQSPAEALERDGRDVARTPGREDGAERAADPRERMWSGVDAVHDDGTLRVDLGVTVDGRAVLAKCQAVVEPPVGR